MFTASTAAIVSSLNATTEVSNALMFSLGGGGRKRSVFIRVCMSDVAPATE
jgi:hypothetical protein